MARSNKKSVVLATSNENSIEHENLLRLEKDLNSMKTKSDEIRYLSLIGLKRGEIAKYMNIRYQHVRNVLTKELKKSK